jgi:hypothetical protein
MASPAMWKHKMAERRRTEEKKEIKKRYGWLGFRCSCGQIMLWAQFLQKRSLNTDESELEVGLKVEER